MEGRRNLGGQGHIARELSLGSCGSSLQNQAFCSQGEVDRVRVDWFTAEGPKANNQQVILY